MDKREPSSEWKSWRAAWVMELEPYYCYWVSHLTSEGLHAKSDIATVLALLHRQRDDMEKNAAGAQVPEDGRSASRSGVSDEAGPTGGCNTAALLTDAEIAAAWNGAVEESKTKGIEMYMHLMRAIAIAQHRKAAPRRVGHSALRVRDGELEVFDPHPPAVTDAMVNRFLAWKLPEDFRPDAGISFSPYFNVEYNAKRGLPPQRHDPIGTNLLTATQAQAMLEHVAGPALAAKQAQIDRLMLEYCPDEMTPEQIEEWGKHQRATTPEENAAIAQALVSATRANDEEIIRPADSIERIYDEAHGVAMKETQGETADSHRAALCNVYAAGKREVTRSATRVPDRATLLREVEQRIHDCYNLQKASAWPHCEGVARAKLIVRAMIEEAEKALYVGGKS